MSPTKARFYVSNFGGCINLNLDKNCALLLFDLIRAAVEEGKDVPEELYAMTERIEKQFYNMRMLTTRPERKVAPATETETEVSEELAA